MHIVILGLNHQTAPVDTRERLAFKAEEIPAALERLRRETGLNEALILSTCNRVELYGVTEERKPEECRHRLVALLADIHRLPAADFADKLYFHTDEAAVRHSFRVASSLDSMVIGEPQILGQLKDAFFIASEARATGLILNRLMHRSFFIAKEVRTRTQIASSAVSVSFAAVELAKKIFGELKGKKVMLIGAGEMCELAARHFVNQGIERVLVTNRTFNRAKELAAEFEGLAISFDSFRQELDEADIVLSSTGSPDYLIGPAELAAALKKRRNRPIFLIDIAVPRDIDPAVNELDNIYLFDVDDLKEVITENLDQRQQEALRAEGLVDKEVEKFEQWLASLAVTPTIKALRRQLQELAGRELEKTISALPDLGARERRKLEAMVNAITNKFLHHPLSYLKTPENSSAGGPPPAVLIRRIFKLPDDDEQQ